MTIGEVMGRRASAHSDPAASAAAGAIEARMKLMLVNRIVSFVLDMVAEGVPVADAWRIAETFGNPWPRLAQVTRGR